MPLLGKNYNITSHSKIAQIATPEGVICAIGGQGIDETSVQALNTFLRIYKGDDMILFR